jgi:hypothetical protein
LAAQRKNYHYMNGCEEKNIWQYRKRTVCVSNQYQSQDLDISHAYAKNHHYQQDRTAY